MHNVSLYADIDGKRSHKWKTYSQTLHQSQCVPATTTQAQSIFCKNPIPEAAYHFSSTSQHGSLSAHQLINTTSNSTAHRFGITMPSTEGAQQQIPTSLQRLVQANISVSQQQPITSHGVVNCDDQSPLKRCGLVSSSFSSIHANTTSLASHTVPLSITTTTGDNSDEVEPTPLTPLSPFCSQQGMLPMCRTDRYL